MAQDPITIYCFPPSFYSQKALLALEEKGVPYKLHYVNIGAYDNYAEWFMKINPLGKVPVIDDGGKIISDSVNIIEYLDKIYGGPSLMPEDKRAKWTYYQNKLDEIKIETLTFGSFYHPEMVKNSQFPSIARKHMKKKMETGKRLLSIQDRMDKAPENMKPIYEKKLADATIMESEMKDLDLLKLMVQKVKDVLRGINDDLKGRDGEWICGQNFTIADICLTILLERLTKAGYSTDLWMGGQLPQIADYYKRLQTRKSYVKVCKKMFSLSLMIKYVLGENATTYLGLGLALLVCAAGVGIYYRGRCIRGSEI